MTDKSTDPNPEPDNEPEPEDGQTFGADYVKKLRAEAAEHRKARREAESRIEELTGQLHERDRADDDRALSERLADVLADPDDLYRFVDRAEIEDDDGRIDLDTAEAKAKELAEDKSHLAARPKVPVPAADQGARGGVQHEEPKPTAESVFGRISRM